MSHYKDIGLCSFFKYRLELFAFTVSRKEAQLRSLSRVGGLNAEIKVFVS